MAGQRLRFPGDCRACRISNQTAFFLETDRVEEAIAMGEQQQYSCRKEPMSTFHALALAYARAGRGADAGRSYQRALADSIA
ncbi:MAG: hypothetical protein ACK5LS_03300 [Propioniciclava sp.]